MNTEQRFQIQFERYNSKYNRLWENVINIGVFIFATLAAYIIAVGSTERKVAPILTFQNVNYLLLFVGVIVAASMGVLITHLRLTKKELDKMFRKAKMEF